MKQKIYRDTLPEGYNLHWYEFKSVIGRGGYGITYLALDKNLDRMVAIKEYLPTDFASRDSDATVRPITGEKGEIFRWGLDRFLAEARVLAKFKHPNIVRVLSVFEQNNTAYMVMEYEHGENLAKLYKQESRYSEQKLLAVFIPILEGLALVHAEGFIHRDIKPANIYIRDDNSPVLLDFGSARSTGGESTQALTSLVTFGYAPFEQYNDNGGKQGPWTDIYSLGASMYLGIAGNLPVDAMARGASYISNTPDPYKPLTIIAAGEYSPAFLLAIDNALMFHIEDRPQDTLSWMNMILGKIPANLLPLSMMQTLSENGADDQTIIMPRGTHPSQRQTGGVSSAQTRISTRHPVSGNIGDAGEASFRPSSNSYNPAITSPSIRTDSHYSRESDISQLPKFLRWNKQKLVIFVPISLVLIISAIFWGVSSDKNISPSSSTASIPPVTPLKSQSQARKSVDIEIEQLLSQAEIDFTAGRIIHPQGQSAVYRYLRILDLAPDNVEAKKGVDKTLNYYANTAATYESAQNYSEADKNIKIMEAIAPQSAITIAARKQYLSIAKEFNKVATLLDKAKSLLVDKKYMTPAGNNAYEYFKQVLEIDPTNTQAKNGLATITNYYALSTANYLNSNDLPRARNAIEKLEMIDPAMTKIEALRKQYNTIAAANTRIEQWLGNAANDFANGRITKPEKNSAWYWYSRVLEVDPNNSQANKGMEKILAHFHQRFEEYLAGKKVGSAKDAMQTVYEIAPDSQSYKQMKLAYAENMQPAKPDIEVISELIGSYKNALENHDLDKIKALSAVSPSRENFMGQLFEQYTKFTVKVSGVKLIGKENRATARVSFIDLINAHGDSVQAGQWGRFDIEIRKTVDNQWKIFW